MGRKKSVTVRYELDPSGVWVAQVKEYPAAITQAPSIRQARVYIREALWALTDDEEWSKRVGLVDDVALPASMRRAIQQVEREREAAAEAMERASASLREVVEELCSLRLSTRDVGDLLGLSGQRVQQLQKRAAG